MFPKTFLKSICLILIAVLAVVVAPLYAADNVFSKFETAIRNTDLSTIQALIEAGADVNASDDGMTPLMFASAAYNYSPDIINSLVAAGADVNAKDKDGNTPLLNAITFEVSCSSYR